MSTKSERKSYQKIYALINRPSLVDALETIISVDAKVNLSTNCLLDNPMPFADGFDTSSYFSAFEKYEWFRDLKLTDNLKCFLLVEALKNAAKSTEWECFSEIISKKIVKNDELWEVARSNFANFFTDVQKIKCPNNATLDTMMATYKCKPSQLLEEDCIFFHICLKYFSHKNFLGN
jgi:hypothetical protein